LRDPPGQRWNLRDKSKDKRAKNKEQRAKTKEQKNKDKRQKNKEQRSKYQEPSTRSQEPGAKCKWYRPMNQEPSSILKKLFKLQTSNLKPQTSNFKH
jgi:hypothetical protein